MKRPIDRARELRRDSTLAESAFWHAIRNRELGGFKFRRQQPIGPYIVDFICHDAKLVVELDGGQHAVVDETARTNRIQAEGYRVVRFWNNEILDNLDGVLETLLIRLSER